MPISPKFLRPRASGYTATDADAKAYIAAVETADGSKLENKTRKAIDDFVKGLKSDSIWTPLTHCCILAGARTLAGICTPLKGTAPTSNAFLAADYNRKTGLVGSTANTKFLNTNVNNNTFTQNDFHMSVWVGTAQTSGSTLYMMGAGGGGTGASEIFASVGFLQFRNQNGSGQTGAGAADSITGLIASTRSGSTTFDMRYGGTLTSAGSRASQSPLANGNIHVFRTSAFSTLFSNARLRWYSLGTSIDTGKLSTRLTTLYADLSAAIV
jgi:hypothetical protein